MHDVPWIVVAATPGEPAGAAADLRGEPLRAWVRRQVAVWPAPIPIGERPPRPGADTAGAPYEVWNRDAHGFRPVGDRLAAVRPVRGSAGLPACLSAGVAGTARPLVLGLLRQFGLTGSRHIDAAGVLRRRHFTGYDERISAWSEAIGVPSR